MVLLTISRFAGAKRIPLIKFRKGGNLTSATEAPSSAATQASDSSKPATSKIEAVASGVAIEDWELPPRYWRKPIDKMEEEYINRGGPA